MSSSEERATENVVILGSGCAGLTAAIYAARANLAPLVVMWLFPLQLNSIKEISNEIRDCKVRQSKKRIN